MRVWGRGILVAPLAALLLALPTAATPALAAKPKGLTLSSFKLKGSHGYEIEALAGQEGSGTTFAAISATFQSLGATYEAPAEPGSGMHADFGALGSLDLNFHRKERHIERFRKDCKVITEIGVFRGRFNFSGEAGYTSAEATAVSGEVTKFPDGVCFLDDFRRAPAPTLSLPPFLRGTLLVARSRTANGSIELEASKMNFDPEPRLSVQVKEKVGAIRIVRSASARLAKHGLVFGPGKPPRSADLKPPPPFSGTARFGDPTSGPPTWTGSLAISLPGAPGVAFAGPEFAARICLNTSPLGGCKVDLPPGKGRPEPEL
jgi:hypothetical protein